MRTVRIQNAQVGPACPCFVIAEIGSNHDGKMDQAKRLIDAASAAGADAVKFQSFRADHLTVRTDPDYDLLKSVELPREWCKEISSYCGQRGILFLSTPFDFEAVDLLEEIDVPAYKIASGDITYYPLLRHIASTGKPIILSTGKSDLFDVKGALEYLARCGGRDVVLLHCVASYPASIGELNLSVIPNLKKHFDVPVGFSDHTQSIMVPAFAVCYGADVIEKHLTIDRALPGPDHAYAMNADEFREIVLHIRDAEGARGSGEKALSESESQRALTGRRAIFAVTDIKRGTLITESMIACLRPQMEKANIPAREHESVIGSRAKRDIRKGSPLTREDVGP